MHAWNMGDARTRTHMHTWPLILFRWLTKAARWHRIYLANRERKFSCGHRGGPINFFTATQRPLHASGIDIPVYTIKRLKKKKKKRGRRKINEREGERRKKVKIREEDENKRIESVFSWKDS